MSHLDEQFLVQVLHRQGEGLVPCGVEVFINHFAFVECFPIQFEFHIRVAGAWKWYTTWIIVVYISNCHIWQTFLTGIRPAGAPVHTAADRDTFCYSDSTQHVTQVLTEPDNKVRGLIRLELSGSRYILKRWQDFCFVSILKQSWLIVTESHVQTRFLDNHSPLSLNF